MEGFVKISKYAGMREDLVQAGGGNSSFKISDDKMAVKASGFQLADITINDGYALVNQKIIMELFLNASDFSNITENVSKTILEDSFIEGKKPSIETFLHAISGRYTLHTHPIVVNVLACRKGGMKVLRELFPKALIVPYATPGVELAKAYFNSYKESAGDNNVFFDIVFLQNHGLVVSADTADEVIEKTEFVIKKIEEYLDVDFLSYHELTMIWNYFPSKIVWKVTDENIISVFSEIGVWRHGFCPDCVVFLGKSFLDLPNEFDEKGIEKFRELYGEPVIVTYKGTLYILADSVNKALETQSIMSFSAQVMDINRGYECNMLSDEEHSYLLNWDAEKYRKTMR